MINKKIIMDLNAGKIYACQTIYENYFPALCIFAERYLGDKSDAADIVQDTFVALWQGRGEFESEARLRSFLYVSVRNRAFNLLRHRRMQAGKQGEIIRSFAETNETEAVVGSELARQMMGLMNELPPECRKVMRLSIEGISYKEIAEMLDISVSTVRNHRILAVKKLKTIAVRKNLKLYLLIRPFL